MGIFDKQEMRLEIADLKRRLEAAEARANTKKETTILHVPLSSSAIDVYQATSREYNRHRMFSTYPFKSAGEQVEKPKWHGYYFRSCHDAFKTCGDDAEVTRERALIFEDGSLFILPANVRPDKFWQDGEA